jgi:hypothetical protein
VICVRARRTRQGSRVWLWPDHNLAVNGSQDVALGSSRQFHHESLGAGMTVIENFQGQDFRRGHIISASRAAGRRRARLAPEADLWVCEVGQNLGRSVTQIQPRVTKSSRHAEEQGQCRMQQTVWWTPADSGRTGKGGDAAERKYWKRFVKSHLSLPDAGRPHSGVCPAKHRQAFRH